MSFLKEISIMYQLLNYNNQWYWYCSPNLLVTAQKPDLVINDKSEEKMDIFELTVLLETNIKNANTQKMNKYKHFITDITTRDVSVYPYEIGSRGYVAPSNKANLKK